MAHNREYGYLQFPLCLIRETYRDVEDGLNLILSFGIVNYATKLDYYIVDVAKQLLYSYTRKRNILQADVVRKLRKVEDKLILEDEFLFDGNGNFKPDDDAVDIVLKLLESDAGLKDGAILNYQIHLATSYDHLNINIGSNDSTIRRYKEALKIKQEFEGLYGPDAMPMCKKGMLFEFRDKQQKDIVLFRAYVGIRSIIGRNNYAATHKTVILCRMMGCKTNIALQNFLKDNEAAMDVYKKYSGRKRMDNLLFKLTERKFMTMVSQKHESRIYVSVKYQNPVELAEAILKNRSENNLRKQLGNASNML